MGGHSPLEQEDSGGPAGYGLPTWEGCLSHHDPLMFRILAVAYPELEGRLRASQQPQGASSGGEAVAPEQEGAASHLALEGETTESEATSGMEGEGSSTTGTGGDSSDRDSSSDGSSLAVVCPSVPPASTGAVLTVVIAAVFGAPNRGAGRPLQGVSGVLDPWCPGSSRGVESLRVLDKSAVEEVNESEKSSSSRQNNRRQFVQMAEPLSVVELVFPVVARYR
ncbi:hypothetical protein NDU88_006607 [Pleurodeles waltl]|uniref:Uncharacterized protein n=1 Tax=Pleurodeles waltl TaxID=8319 RepID=A0AAV7PIX6_PLEWA|nr:hypothetical protein NDU88_006607 [Pleurodeles waltl]